MLEFLKGDKAELQDLVDSTADLVAGNYTEESWTALQEALTNANTVLFITSFSTTAHVLAV